MQASVEILRTKHSVLPKWQLCFWTGVGARWDSQHSPPLQASRGKRDGAGLEKKKSLSHIKAQQHKGQPLGVLMGFAGC